jgi:hypothetical protein
MTKLKLDPAPTFTAPVAIPVAGGGFESVKFTFKHRTRDEMQAFLKTVDELKDVEMVRAVATGWELTDDFDSENIEKLVQNYIGSPKAIFDTYLDELFKARQKN